MSGRAISCSRGPARPAPQGRPSGARYVLAQPRHYVAGAHCRTRPDAQCRAHSSTSAWRSSIPAASPTRSSAAATTAPMSSQGCTLTSISPVAPMRPVTLPATETEALDFLEALPSKPSLILHTGGGLHAYWLFESPVWLHDRDRPRALSHLMRQFTQRSVRAGRHTAGRSMPYAIWRGCSGPQARSIINIVPPSRSSTRVHHRYTAGRLRLAHAAARAQRPPTAPGAGAAALSTPRAHDKPDLVMVLAAYGCTLTRKSDEEWHGAHPTHGSSTGVNLDVNPAEQVWHCWRHDTGGDVFDLIAVCEGLLACEDVSPGCLEGELFPQVLGLAETRFGWIPPDAVLPRPRRLQPRGYPPTGHPIPP